MDTDQPTPPAGPPAPAPELANNHSDPAPAGASALSPPARNRHHPVRVAIVAVVLVAGLVAAAALVAFIHDLFH